MEPNEAQELQEQAEHAEHEKTLRPVALTMTILAVLVAVVTVLGHRTQAPSGLGYALENRVIVSRLFGENFAAMRVQRLAASYRRLLETLIRHAPRDPGEKGGPPRIVLLPRS